MVFIARNGETEAVYIVEAANEEKARARLGNKVDSDGDEFAIVEAKLPKGQKIADITDKLF